MKNLFLLLTSIASIQLLIAQDFSGPMALTDENYDKISSNRSNPTVRGTIHGASAEELDQLVVSYTLVRPNDPFKSSMKLLFWKTGHLRSPCPAISLTNRSGSH